MKHDEITLIDLFEALRRIVRFSAGISKEAFLADDKTQSAVIRQLEILGEAVKRLSPDFKEARPSLPWRQMADMRDKLIHAYDEVDSELVWQTVERDVPALLTALEALSK